MKPLIIMGSGLAGYMLAKEFRKLDKELPLVIVTASEGVFYSKPLLSTALTNNRDLDKLTVYTAEQMAEQLTAKIHTQCEVSDIKPEQKQIIFKKNSEQTMLEYSQLVLACGANKIAPELKGNAAKHYYSVNQLEDYVGFRQWLKGKKKIALLGAGLVGCEFANDLANVGYQVDIIAPEQHPLASFVPDKIGNCLMRALHKKGVEWRLGCLMKELNQTTSGVEYQLNDGSVHRVDGVFSAIGIRPNLNLANKANLFTQRGIVVDRYLRTSDPHIYALGDCAEVAGEIKQYVAPILICARALAKVLIGQEQPVQYPCMPVVIKTPDCPVVSYPPPLSTQGEWEIKGDPDHLSALFYDEKALLRGFALVGDKVRDRRVLAKKIPVVF